MHYTYHKTPIGKILIAGNDSEIRMMSFPQGSQIRQIEPDWTESKKPFKLAISQLDDYFSGARLQFELPLSPAGTIFQQQVWQALLAIPYGQTTSYGELAKKINRPKASRAVGAANGANPIPIVIPCHRVIGSTGNLTGFGGGIPTKQWLLAHEKKHCPTQNASDPQSAFRF